MKILSAQQIKEIDAKTVAYENISSLELMKRAANAFFGWFTARYADKSKPVVVVCGMGNNGGDGLVVARLLAKAGYPLNVWMVEHGKNFSPDCAHNLRRAKSENIAVKTIACEDEIPDFSECNIIIDAIFGIGLSRAVCGISQQIVGQINKSGKTIVSIDVPSGMFLDRKTDFAVCATHTVTFQIPKLALFLPENHQFAGNVHTVPIGLSEKALSETGTDTFFTEKTDIKKMLKPLAKFAHKGTQGHALIVGGSLGKSGAVCLAAKAALKSGCGLVTACVPKCATSVVTAFCPETMVVEDVSDAHISDIRFHFAADAVGIGVGLGRHPETESAFRDFLQRCRCPLVVDADGLNILSENREWLSLLPHKTILTPHPKELERLVGCWDSDFEKIEKTKRFSAENHVIVIIKGAYSTVVDGEKIFVNGSGTPALATAGSGDVLTGIITGLLAQGYAPVDAARIGVFVHGFTADVTQNAIHPRSFTASDIIGNIGNAYFGIER